MNGPDAAEVWQEVAQWMGVAEADRRAALACVNASPPLCGAAAFHCQQAAEKLLKGFLVLGLIDFGKTHNMEQLGSRVVAVFPAVAAFVEPLRDWTVWSVAYRYPADAGAIRG